MGLLRRFGRSTKTPRATDVANIARDTLVAEARGRFAEARGSKAFLAEARGRLAEETRKVYVKKAIAVNRRANRVFLNRHIHHIVCLLPLQFPTSANILLKFGGKASF